MSSLLHRHALESVFAFLSLAELHAAVSVCRTWSDAVASMRPIEGVWSCKSHPITACFPSDLPAASAASARLDRHVFRLGSPKNQVDLADIVSPNRLAQRFVNLQQLHFKCCITIADVRALVLPRAVRVLSCTIEEKEENEEDEAEEEKELSAEEQLAEDTKYAKEIRDFAQATLDAVGRCCPLLEDLNLSYPGDWHYGQIAFEPVSLQSLVELKHLQSLELHGTSFLAAHVPSLRALGHLRRAVLNLSASSAEVIEQVFVQPGAPQWQDVGRLHNLDDRTALMLGLLGGSLTRLRSDYVQVDSFDFLQSMRVLTSVQMDMSAARVKDLAAAAAKGYCTSWRELIVTDFSRASSGDFRTLLSGTPALESLHILWGGAITKLNFLRVVAPTLRELRLEDITYERNAHGKAVLKPLPFAEADELARLEQLRSLQIRGIFRSDTQEAVDKLEKKLRERLTELTTFEFAAFKGAE